jgi:CheY-like chemotaxis protein
MVSKKQKILLIIDDWEKLERTEELLQKDHEVLCAGFGDHGIQLAKEHLPDLILYSLEFESWSHQDLLDALRQIPELHHTQVQALPQGTQAFKMR